VNAEIILPKEEYAEGKIRSVEIFHTKRDPAFSAQKSRCDAVS
jgi:hypothetical protein